MFSIILRKAGFRRTFSPFLFQTQDFKREVVPSDLDPSHPDNPFNKEKEKQKECYGLDLRNHPRLDRVNIEWIIQAYRNSNKPEQFFLDPGFRRHAGTHPFFNLQL